MRFIRRTVAAVYDIVEAPDITQAYEVQDEIPIFEGALEIEMVPIPDDASEHDIEMLANQPKGAWYLLLAKALG